MTLQNPSPFSSQNAWACSIVSPGTFGPRQRVNVAGSVVLYGVAKTSVAHIFAKDCLALGVLVFVCPLAIVRNIIVLIDFNLFNLDQLLTHP